MTGYHFNAISQGYYPKKPFQLLDQPFFFIFWWHTPSHPLLFLCNFQIKFGDFGDLSHVLKDVRWRKWHPLAIKLEARQYEEDRHKFREQHRTQFKYVVREFRFIERWYEDRNMSATSTIAPIVKKRCWGTINAISSPSLMKKKSLVFACLETTRKKKSWCRRRKKMVKKNRR